MSRLTDLSADGPAPSTRLRGVTFATATAGIWTMVAAGVVAAPIGAAAVLVTAGATALSVILASPAARENRRRAAVLALGVAALTAVVSNGGTLTDSTGSVLGLLLCTAVISHSLVLDTVRDLRVNVAISISMLLLAAGLAPGLSIAIPVVVTWCCAVAALVLASDEGQGAVVTARASVVTTDANGAIEHATVDSRPWGTVARCVTMSLLVGLALALIIPHPPGVSARSSFGSGSDASRTPSAAANRAAAAYLGDGALDLNSRGRLSDAPVAVVTGDPNVLWRATVLPTYDGRSWSPRNDLPNAALGTNATAVKVPADTLSPPQPQPTQRDGVGWLAESAPVVLSPGLPTAVELRQDGTVIRERDGRLTLASSTSTPSYAVTSSVVPKVRGISGPEIGRDATEPVWRELPSTLPARVVDLARQITAGASTRAESVKAVEAYLRANATYDLDSPVAPRGTDTVDEFLFTSRSGFCEHFASAEVVLLRAVGIPSRLASGFTSGPADAEGRTVLLASDAHAWAEVWIQGSGWVSSDPTAGATLASHSGGGLIAAFQRLLDAATGSGVRKVVVAIVLVLLAAAALLLPGLRRRRRTVVDTGPVPTGPLFLAFHRFEEALARSGNARAPAESVRALATRWDDAPDRDVVRALLTVERASYANVPPTPDETRAATDAIDRATAALLTDRPSR